MTDKDKIDIEDIENSLTKEAGIFYATRDYKREEFIKIWCEVQQSKNNDNHDDVIDGLDRYWATMHPETCPPWVLAKLDQNEELAEQTIETSEEFPEQ